MATMKRALLCLTILPLVHCSSSPPGMSAPPDMGAPPDMTQPPDLAPQGRNPKEHPDPFAMKERGGPILPSMELYTVVWKGNEDIGAKLDQFHGVMLGSDYW